MSNKTLSMPAAKRYTTIMTQEGVSDPALLSPDGQLIHARRLGGPGTRSKNPKAYDAKKPMFDAINAQKNENRKKSKAFLTEKAKPKSARSKTAQ